MKLFKKSVAALASLTVFAGSLAMPTVTAFADEVVFGDFNNDGFFNLTDISAALKAYANNDTLDSRTLSAIDTNGDGKITILDFTELIKEYANPTRINWAAVPYVDEMDILYKDIEGGVEITDYIGKETILKFPETVDGKPIIRFQNFNRNKRAEITAMKLPDTILTINGGSLDGFNNIKFLVLPNQITELYEIRGTSPNILELPDSIVSVGNGQNKQTDFVCHDTDVKYKGVVYSSDEQYKLCDLINYVDECGLVYERKGDNVKVVGASRLVTDVVIPDYVTEINANAFKRCTELKSITIPNSVVSLTSTFDTFDGHYTAFIDTQLKTLTLPDSLTKLDYNAINYDTIGANWAALKGTVFESITWKGKTYQPHQYSRLCQDVNNQN